MEKSICTILLVAVIVVSFLFFVGSTNQVFAEGCMITLLWNWKGQDFDATQGQPAGIATGESVIFKAQFRDCQGDGNKGFLLWGKSEATKTVGPRSITSNFVEVRQTVNLNSPGEYGLAARVEDKSGNFLSRTQFYQLKVTGSGGGTGTGGDEVDQATCDALKAEYDKATDSASKEAIKQQAKDKGCAWAGGGGTIGGGGNPPGGGGTTSSGVFTIEPYGPTDFVDLVNTIARWIFNIAIPVAIIMIIYAGIMMILAQGDSGKFNKARDILKYAVLGLVVIFIGKGFISLIKSILSLGS